MSRIVTSNVAWDRWVASGAGVRRGAGVPMVGLLGRSLPVRWEC